MIKKKNIYIYIQRGRGAHISHAQQLRRRCYRPRRRVINKTTSRNADGKSHTQHHNIPTRTHIHCHIAFYPHIDIRKEQDFKGACAFCG